MSRFGPCWLWRRQAYSIPRSRRGWSGMPTRATTAGVSWRPGAGTRTRLLEERATAEARRWNGFMIGVLVVFGWATGLTLWILVRVFTGAVLTVFGANLVSGLTWSLVSVVLSWMTAAAAALMLGKSRQMRRAL